MTSQEIKEEYDKHVSKRLMSVYEKIIFDNQERNELIDMMEKFVSEKPKYKDVYNQITIFLISCTLDDPKILDEIYDKIMGTTGHNFYINIDVMELALNMSKKYKAEKIAKYVEKIIKI